MVPANTNIYNLSLHDALPISTRSNKAGVHPYRVGWSVTSCVAKTSQPLFAALSLINRRIEAGLSLLCSRKKAEIRLDRKRHTSELQSRPHLVCRLLLEKKKKK